MLSLVAKETRVERSAIPGGTKSILGGASNMCHDNVFFCCGVWRPLLLLLLLLVLLSRDVHKGGGRSEVALGRVLPGG